MLARAETPLKTILDREGRSQAWLARMVGVHRQQVWMWCNGIHEPTDDTKAAIAQALGRQMHELWPEADAKAAA